MQRSPSCSNFTDHGRMRRLAGKRPLERPGAVGFRHNKLRRITPGQGLDFRLINDIRGEGDMVAAFNHAHDRFFRTFEPMKMRSGNAMLLQQITGGNGVLVDRM
ncbi:hypothetical protein D3C87_1800540 [compost metagenome]